MRNILVYLAVLIFLVLGALLLPIGLMLDKVKNGTARKLGFWIARNFLGTLFFLAGIQVLIKGKENLPEGNALYVMNHQSNLDPLVLLAFFPRKVSYVAKKEIEKFPIVASWMHKMECLFMDREDVRQSLGVIKQAQNCLERGLDMGIFPEGTRSLDGQLLPFKAGSIKMAIKAKKQIVPVAIQGTMNIMKKGSLLLSPQKVIITILPSFSAEKVSTGDSNQLISELEESIKKAIE